MASEGEGADSNHYLSKPHAEMPMPDAETPTRPHAEVPTPPGRGDAHAVPRGLNIN